MNFTKEARYEFRYVRTDGSEKVCYPRSEEKKNENLRVCKERGYRVLSVKKLYPDLIARHIFTVETNVDGFSVRLKSDVAVF